MAVVAALAATVLPPALASSPALAAATQEVISSAGPLSAIYVDNDLACQVQDTGDVSPSFSGGTEPGGCGTFLAITKGEGLNEPGERHLFGPTPAKSGGAVHPEADFTPVRQERSGSGTIKTYVEATELSDGVAPFPVAELVETDSYATGQDSYETTITITNRGGLELVGTLYHAGDCNLADDEFGYGAASVPTAGSVACTLTPNDVPPARYLAFTPISTEGGLSVGSATYVESKWPTFWEDIKPTAEPFRNEVDATEDVTHGMGLSWPIKLGPVKSGKETASVKFLTTVAPPSPPTSTTTAGACVPSGQVPITVSAGDGPKAVRYVLDGGAEQSAETDEAGQVTISLTPGQHTLEYWAEDQTDAQESPHHVVNVTVASGGPTLTISSDEGRNSYEVGETASVTIAASGPGLTSNPSKIGEPISTSTPGTYTVARSAANACGTTSASFTYTVIPPPALGKTLNVEPVSGKVYVAVPTTAASASFFAPLESAIESLSKGLKFVPLNEARQVPVGSTLEATSGIARITTATASQGKTQSGEFGAGIFKLLQNRKQKGLTELDLIDNRSSKQTCASVGKKAAVTAKLNSKTLGRLTGSAHGKFTTRGQYSAATVRGTSWGVLNQCDGTLTVVHRGEVSVRDFVRRKTITLFTGQSYLAKAPI